MTSERFDVVVVGNAGIDTNVYMPGGDIDFSVEANFTENLTCVGNAGGYASRGYAQLGKRTAFLGYLGDDTHGRFIREEFAHDGIDLTGLFSDPEGTAHSINFMYQDGRRKNFYDGKGHMQLHPDMGICQAVFSQVALAHFNIPNWARHLLPLAREMGLLIAIDLQDVVSVDDLYRGDFIRQADYLFFSAVNFDDPKPLIDAFLAIKPDMIVVSGMGARGCALGINNCVRYFQAVELETPIFDTNGAGDALAVGFLSSYVMDGYSLEDSVLRGQIAARHTCSVKADSSQLITLDQLDAIYKNFRDII